MTSPEDTIGKIKKFLESPQNIYIVGKSLELFQKIIGYTEYCFFKEITSVSPQYLEDLMRSFLILEEFYVEKPIDRNLSNFVVDYVLLVHNLNTNAMKNKAIEHKCILVDRLYKDIVTVVQVFNFLKEIVRKYNNITNYALPSVEISRHYLESFNRKSEDKK